MSLITYVMDQNSDKAKSPPPRFNDERDVALVARFREGDVAAFEELVSRHQSRLMRLICRLLDCPEDSEDVLQDVLVSVYEGLSRFRGEASFATWTTTIAVNKCRTFRRRAGRRRRMIRLLETKSNRVVEDGRQGREEGEEVRQAVRTLPAAYREPVVLYYFEQMSATEISRVLDCKPNTIEARLSRARRALRAILHKRLGGATDE